MLERGNVQCDRVHSEGSEDDHVVTSIGPTAKEKPPTWWNPAGSRMEFAGQTRQRLLFHSINAKFAIVRTNSPEVFVYEWEITHGRHDTVKGTVEVTEAVVLASFGIADMTLPEGSKKIAKQYGADFFAQSRAIRKGNYLNVPCAGMGFPGDPNLSFLVTPEAQEHVIAFFMKDAV